MPRQARIKPEGVETTYHICNRVAGDPNDLPFGDPEKEKFAELVHRLASYYSVEVLAFNYLGNHYHLLLHPAVTPPSNEETVRRYEAFYEGKRWLDPQSERCAEIGRRLHDISWFVRDLQQRFTTWFNHTRTSPRRGGLWAGRFKSCIVEEGESVWRCLKYIEMNAVRANIVRDPGDYRFCSWGVWSRTGRHPFAESLLRHVLPSLDWLPADAGLDGLRKELRMDLLGMTAQESGVVGNRYDDLMAKASSGVPFHFDLEHRCRYWSDAVVIGSDTFVLNTVARGWGRKAVEKRHLKPAAGADKTVCAYRHLRKNGL
jgi:hypothetical protein